MPGGRIQKNETLDDVFVRLTKAELTVGELRSTVQWLGAYEYFYDDYVFGEGISIHYIVLAYQIVVDIRELNLPTAQHSKYRWMTKHEIGDADLVYQYNKDYFI
ncbi:MAG: colanic acid biosynthesis protein WcaH [Zhongshania sp.]|jgi:colanic acid biosynthesis protein WcaH